MDELLVIKFHSIKKCLLAIYIELGDKKIDEKA